MKKKQDFDVHERKRKKIKYRKINWCVIILNCFLCVLLIKNKKKKQYFSDMSNISFIKVKVRT